MVDKYKIVRKKENGKWKSIICFTELLDEIMIKILPRICYPFIKKVNLWDSGIPAIPSKVFQFKNLEHLLLEGNQIKTVPKAIGQLKKLQYISFDENLLSTLPSEISKLPHLMILNAKSNLFVELPPILCQKFKDEVIRTNIDYKRFCD